MSDGPAYEYEIDEEEDEEWLANQFSGLSMDDKRRIRDLVGRCELCGETKRLTVDHCHRCGGSRGVLCSRCNTQRIPTWESDWDDHGHPPPTYACRYLHCECRDLAHFAPMPQLTQEMIDMANKVSFGVLHPEAIQT